ncbi:MAG: DUF5654 family protein [Candidatus Moranbacteria bacterium]|nr:DUF5654 family protein [Candidatus Moranbacteria bacterium]
MGIDRIKEESRAIKQEVNKKLVTYITAGFGLVAGLAWNEAIKSFIEYFFPMKANSLLAQFVYAIIITFILVLISVYLTRILVKEEKK